MLDEISCGAHLRFLDADRWNELAKAKLTWSMPNLGTFYMNLKAFDRVNGVWKLEKWNWF